MSLFPNTLTDRDLDLATAGSLRVDPNDYEEYAINRGLISVDFEGDVTVRPRQQIGYDVGIDLTGNEW